MIFHKHCQIVLHICTRNVTEAFKKSRKKLSRETQRPKSFEHVALAFVGVPMAAGCLEALWAQPAGLEQGPTHMSKNSLNKQLNTQCLRTVKTFFTLKLRSVMLTKSDVSFLYYKEFTVVEIVIKATCRYFKSVYWHILLEFDQNGDHIWNHATRSHPFRVLQLYYGEPSKLKRQPNYGRASTTDNMNVPLYRRSTAFNWWNVSGFCYQIIFAYLHALAIYTKELIQ